MSWTSSTLDRGRPQNRKSSYGTLVWLWILSLCSGLSCVLCLHQTRLWFGYTPQSQVGMATVWVFAVGLGWMLGGRFGSRKGWNSLSIMGWCCVSLGALLGLAPQAMVQWGQDIRTSSMPLAIMMTWVALLSTMMGWVLSLFTSGNGQQANRRSAIALWFMSLAYALGQCFLLPIYGLESLVLWVSASWLLLGASGLVMKVRWGTANLSEEISESLPADQGEWGVRLPRPVMTWSLALMMGVTLGGLMKVLQWTLGNMHLWHSVFLVLGLGALVVGFIGSTRAKRIPAEPGAWLYLITGVFSLIACCFYEDLPFWLGWVQGQFADVSEAWVLFASAVVILGGCLMVPPLLCMGYLAGRHVALHRPVVGVPYPILLSMMGFACWFLLIQTAGSWIPAFRVVGLPAALCLALALYQGFTGTGLQGLRKVASGLGGVLLLSYVSFQWSSNWMAVFSQTDPLATGFFKTKPHTLQWARQSTQIYYRETPEGTLQIRSYDYPEPNQQLELIVNGQVIERSYAQRVQQAVNAVVPCGLQSDATDIAILGMRAGLLAGYVSELLKEASIVAVDPCDELKEVVSLFGPFNGEVLEQTRFEWVSQQPHVYMNDQKSFRTFDLIMNQHAMPWLADQEDLFTVEFFEACRSRLSENGLMVQNIQLTHLNDASFHSILGTFGQVFPYFSIWDLGFGECLLLGAVHQHLNALNRLETFCEQESVQAILEQHGLSSWPTLLLLERVSSENGYHLMDDDTLLHTATFPSLRWMAPGGRSANEPPASLRLFDERKQLNASTLLAAYLRQKDLSVDQLRAMSLLHLDHELLDANLFRSLLQKWIAYEPESEALRMLLASTAEGEHATARDVEGLIEYIEGHPGRNTELLQQATVMMMELYRNQQTVVYDPSKPELGAYIEQLITEDPSRQRTYRMWLAELAWGRNDLDTFRTYAEQSLNPDMELFGPVDDSIDPSAKLRTMCYLAEDAWRDGDLEGAREICAAVIQGDLLELSDAYPPLRKLVRRVLFALQEAQSESLLETLEP